MKYIDTHDVALKAIKDLSYRIVAAASTKYSTAPLNNILGWSFQDSVN